MSLTANAWVSDQGSATITLWSSVGWTHGSWSLEGSSTQFPDESYISLYNTWRQSGTGEIDGDYLTIFIPVCPEGFFTLEMEHGRKRFLLIEGQISFGSELVGVNGIRIFRSDSASGEVSEAQLAKAFLYFASDFSPFKGRLTGQLQKDGVIHATLAGNAVDVIARSAPDSSDRSWALPAMIFTTFYWHIEPTEPTTYDLVFRDSRRDSSKGITKVAVELDMDAVYSPLSSSTYPVQPIDRVYVPMGIGFHPEI